MRIGSSLGEIKTPKRDIKDFLNFIHGLKGIDLSSYRESFITRRLRIRMMETNTTRCHEYSELIEKDPEELNRFFDTLSINVSNFFRDPEVFEAIKESLLPELIQRKVASSNKMIRVWSAGCATGQETYSVAILLYEALKDKGDFFAKVCGTDVDNDALQKARSGIFETSQLKQLKKETLAKYFIAHYNDVCEIKEHIKKLTKFQQHNLIEDPPLRGMDIVLCRNVMIYMTRQQQELLFDKFYNSLNFKGYLVVGQVETLWNNDRFRAVDLRRRIYQKKQNKITE